MCPSSIFYCVFLQDISFLSLCFGVFLELSFHSLSTHFWKESGPLFLVSFIKYGEIWSLGYLFSCDFYCNDLFKLFVSLSLLSFVPR